MSKELQKSQSTPAVNQQAAVMPWKQALINAEHKFMAITDPKKAKIELGFAVQIIEANPSLKSCSMASIQNSIINVARLGSTLNPAMKLCYLIPRKGQCVLDISYVGLSKILTDGGDVKYITASIVYTDEEFAFDPINTKHVPKFAASEKENNERTIFGALSTAILKDDTRLYEFIPLWELQKIERMSSSSGSSFSPYKDWRTEMYKKAVIKRHYKFLPKGNPDHEKLSAMQEVEQQVFGNAPAPAPVSVSEMIDDTPYEEIQSDQPPASSESPEPTKEQPPAKQYETDQQPTIFTTQEAKKK